jgi:hypothetical protein
VDFLECSSFEQLVLQESIAPPSYERIMDAMEAVDRLRHIEQMGDRILKLTRAGVLSTEHGHALLVDLLAFYSEPLKNSSGIVRISQELRRYNL